MLIAAVVAVSYEMYLGCLKGSREGTAVMAVDQTARAVLGQIGEDVRAAVLTRGQFGFGLRGADGGEEAPAGDVLELSCPVLVRWRAEPEGFDALPLPPRADFRHITYRVITAEEAAEEDTDEGITPTVGLVREERSNLTSQDADERAVHILSRQVLSLNLEYHDGADWVTDWDAGTEDRMPLAVRITLVVVPGEKDLLDEEGDVPALADEISEQYPGARAFTTVVNVPTAVPSEGTRITGLSRGIGP